MKKVWAVSDECRIRAVFSKKKDADHYVRNNLDPQWPLDVEQSVLDPDVEDCPPGWMATASKNWWDGGVSCGTCGRYSLDDDCKDGTTGTWAVAYSLVSLKDAKAKAVKLLEDAE